MQCSGEEGGPGAGVIVLKKSYLNLLPVADLWTSFLTFLFFSFLSCKNRHCVHLSQRVLRRIKCGNTGKTLE